jgi:hypothetical protein
LPPEHSFPNPCPIFWTSAGALSRSRKRSR